MTNEATKKNKKKQTISAQLSMETIEKFDFVMNHYQKQSLTPINKSDTLRILIEKAYREVKVQGEQQ